MLERFTQQTRVFGFEALVLSMVRGDLLGDYAGSYQQVGRHAIPTLVVWGEDDPEITADQIETIRAAIPDHEFLPVSNAGHAVAVTHHGVIIDRIIPWLKRSP